MSLYTYEEICKGCDHAIFDEKKVRFISCKIDKESECNAINGNCPYKKGLIHERDFLFEVISELKTLQSQQGDEFDTNLSLLKTKILKRIKEINKKEKNK